MKIKIERPMVEEIVPDLFAVTASDAAGRHYTHWRHFDATTERSAYTRACLLRAKVAAAGEIELEHWDVHIPYGTDAWLEDGMEVTLMDDEELYHKGWMFA